MLLYESRSGPTVLVTKQSLARRDILEHFRKAWTSATHANTGIVSLIGFSLTGPK